MTPSTTKKLAPLLLLAAGACAPEARYPLSPMIGVRSGADASALSRDDRVITGARINSNKDGSFTVQPDNSSKAISAPAVGFYGPTVKTLDCEIFNGKAGTSKTINETLLIEAASQAQNKLLTVTIDGVAERLDKGGFKNCQLSYVADAMKGPK